jgi:hypothetical protein
LSILEIVSDITSLIGSHGLKDIRDISGIVIADDSLDILIEDALLLVLPALFIIVT